MNQPVLSIVIPTRNRPKYIYSCVKSLIQIKNYQFQIIVQDNSSNYETKNCLQKYLSDPRFIYNHEINRLDMIKNWDNAFENAEGQYICAIGDDDTVNPEIIEVALWLNQIKIDALVPSRPVQYYWPDYYLYYYKSLFSSKLFINNFSCSISDVDATKELEICIKTVGRDFLKNKLPKIYYGLIKRDCLLDLKKETGSFFPGPSPDLAGSIGVAKHIKKLKYIDYPLFIPGSSKNSGAGMGAMKKHIGHLENFPHLPKSSILDWSSNVPRLFAPNALWAECIVQALSKTNQSVKLKDFNIPLLHALCLVFHFDYRKIIIKNFLQSIKKSKKSYIISLFKLMIYCIYSMGSRLKLSF